MQIKSSAIATIFENRQRRWREIGDRVSRLAQALSDHGLGRGDRIAVLMLNQDRYIECYLCASWAVAVIVPLDIRRSIRENADALSDCGAKLLVVARAFTNAGTTLAANVAGGIGLVYADDGIVPDAMLAYETMIASQGATRHGRSDLRPRRCRHDGLLESS